MTEQRHRAPAWYAAASPGQVLGPAVGLVVLLLLVALVLQPGAFAVRVGGAYDRSDVVTAPTVGPSGLPGGGQAAPPREDPDPGRDVMSQSDRGAAAVDALVDLLRARDAAVVSGDAAAWTTVSGDPSDAIAPDGSFVALTALPVTRFESSVVPDTVSVVESAADPVAADPVATATAASQVWSARVETTYELAGGPAVVRTDTVRLEPTEDGVGWRSVGWTPHPGLDEGGTVAPWDLGEVTATVGERGVVVSWADPATPDDGAVPSERLQRAQVRAGQVSTWVERGAVVVDSYLGTGWPRSTLVLAPATTAQYDDLVPGPVPERPDVFAAVTTDVRTPDGGGDLVVLNPTAQGELVEETWQVTVTHELVHVASGAVFGDGQEVWLAEGLADLVGWSSVVPAEVDREDVAGRLLDRVRDGRADVQALPDGDDFTAPDADVVGDAYEGAWLAALLLQDELGVDGLLAVYQDASDGDQAAVERTDAALIEATGDGREAFQARWTAYLTGLAGPPR